jgi:hypothetical protein
VFYYLWEFLKAKADAGATLLSTGIGFLSSLIINSLFEKPTTALFKIWKFILLPFKLGWQ